MDPAGNKNVLFLSKNFRKSIQKIAAVRPDRDFTGKQSAIRRISISKSNRQQQKPSEKDVSGPGQLVAKEWGTDPSDLIRRLPLDMRTILMTLQNIEARV